MIYKIEYYDPLLAYEPDQFAYCRLCYIEYWKINIDENGLCFKCSPTLMQNINDSLCQPIDKRTRLDLMENEEFIECNSCIGTGWILPSIYNPNGHICYKCGGSGHNGTIIT